MAILSRSKRAFTSIASAFKSHNYAMQHMQTIVWYTCRGIGKPGEAGNNVESRGIGFDPHNNQQVTPAEVI